MKWSGLNVYMDVAPRRKICFVLSAKDAVNVGCTDYSLQQKKGYNLKKGQILKVWVMLLVAMGHTVPQISWGTSRIGSRNIQVDFIHDECVLNPDFMV